MAIRPDFLDASGAGRLPFVGRWRELDIFDTTLWKRQRPDEYRVLVFHGVGGSGKTRLLERLKERLDEPDAAGTPRAVIDFELQAHRDPVSGLVHLRNEWRRCGIRTFAFDAAFARYYVLSAPGRDIRNDYPELFALESELLAEIVGAAGEVARDVPGLDLVTKLATRIGGEVLKWARGRGHPLTQTISRLSRQELMAELPMFLGSDLASHAARTEPQRPVCFVDTYEAIWRDFQATFGPGASEPDRWLRKLVTNQPGTLFVIFGRRRIDWDRIDPGWADIVTNVELDALSRDEQDLLLDRHGIRAPFLRDRMIETARGHPLMLSAQIRLYQQLSQTGREPTPQDFPRSHKEVLDRFFSHLDVATRAIMRALAFAGVVDSTLWTHMARSGFTAFDSLSPRDVLEDVFFREVEEGRYVLHEVVRDHLVAELDAHDPAFARRARLAIFRYLDLASGADAAGRGEIPDLSRESAKRDAALIGAADLLATADPGSFADWCLRRFRGDLRDRGSRHRSLLLDRAATLASADPGQQLRLAALQIETNPFDTRAVDRLVTAIEAGAEPDEALLANCVMHLTLGNRQLDQRLDQLVSIDAARHPAAALRIAIGRRDPHAMKVAVRHLLENETERWFAPHWDLFVAAALTDDFGIARAAVQPREDESDEETPDAVAARLCRSCQIARFCVQTGREDWAIPLILEGAGFADERAFFQFVASGESRNYRICAALLGAILRATNRQAEADYFLDFAEGTLAAPDAISGAFADAVQSDDGNSGKKLSVIARDIVAAVRRNALGHDHDAMYRSSAIEFFVNDRGEFLVLCDNPLFHPHAFVFSIDLSDLSFWLNAGLRSFGVPVHPKLAYHLVHARPGLFVIVDEGNGQGLDGGFVPTYAIEKEDWDDIRALLDEAWSALREGWRRVPADQDQGRRAR